VLREGPKVPEGREVMKGWGWRGWRGGLTTGTLAQGLRGTLAQGLRGTLARGPNNGGRWREGLGRTLTRRG